MTTFYLSNVEQYLFRSPGAVERFYENVQALPIDSTSTFIRSVPPVGLALGTAVSILGGPPFAIASGSSRSYSVRVVDSAGVSIVSTTTTDSTGKEVTTRTIDSTSARRPSALEIFRSLRARDDSALRVGRRDSSQRFVGRNIVVGGGGTLASGIAPIRRSLEAFTAGDLTDYGKVIAMTQTSGWKQR